MGSDGRRPERWRPRRWRVVMEVHTRKRRVSNGEAGLFRLDPLILYRPRSDSVRSQYAAGAENKQKQE